MMDDVFCKIIDKNLPADIVDEGDDWLAFKDIHPSAPVHILIIPKRHLANLDDAKDTDAELLGKLLLVANRVAKKLNLEKGFRLIVNHGEDGGQLVPHLHIHLLGGRKLGAKIVRN